MRPAISLTVTANIVGTMFCNELLLSHNDSQGKQLEGRNIYAITFAKGQVPPVKGFWSLTLYNDHHLLSPNLLGRYSLGSKNKNLMHNADGSLTFYWRSHIAGYKQGKQLAAGAKRHVLALPPRLLA